MLNVFKRQGRKGDTTQDKERNRISLGKHAEDIVEDYAKNKGMKILGRNVSYGWGEIDVVAQDGDTIVCIEVKALRGFSSAFTPEQHFDHRKAEQVKKVFEAYLQERNLVDKQQRIDLAAVVVQGDKATIRYYKNVVE